jgi:iron complex transport system substrate-binding protein
VLGGTPPWVAGPDTYIDQVVSLAGGENVFSDLGALYSSVSPEQLLTRDIDVVLLSGAATFDGALAPGARVVPIGDVLEIPGPGVVSAAHLVAEMLHGRSLR